MVSMESSSGQLAQSEHRCKLEERRKPNNNWVLGFKGKIGASTITVAELTAIRNGLAIAWERRIPFLILESDSEMAINLIKTRDSTSHTAGAIIDDCRSLIKKPWNCELKHTLQRNSVANKLASLGYDCNEDCIQILDPPSVILPLLKDDTSSLLHLRL